MELIGNRNTTCEEMLGETEWTLLFCSVHLGTLSISVLFVYAVTSHTFLFFSEATQEDQNDRRHGHRTRTTRILVFSDNTR